MTLTTVPCAGVPVAATTPELACAALVAMAVRGEGADVHLCNAYTLALADRDRALHTLLRASTLNLPDGQGVVWANRVVHRGGRLKPAGGPGVVPREGTALPRMRVYGPDLFLDVFREGQAAQVRHYLLGSTPEVLSRLAAELRTRFPHAQIVGIESPPFRELTDAERASQLDRIRSSGAQIVWLGLGTPKQDHEAARLAAAHPAVYVAVGAAFDFISGNKPQAPLWMQHHGLEWLFRLCSEPRRLWRRVLWGHPRFVWAVCKGTRKGYR
ncbi:WecB/TagA/CpsF family glycosyltransferase [Streptomyces sp. NBC_01465]|uniref:WecB/TagA/CpsF family glycosyltransferase n=1 Tax=Streptomyces sp. NBC_01465 TaxID=2903878 RepID=UPI002E380626|nr:WecB/TagA/CpsF family glycosyltransferase [Streptomyces sp. NBC_01465]